MSNLFDFLDWRGDLTFSQDPFHDLDALVLSQISYFTLENIIDEDEQISVEEAWEQMKDGDVSSRFTAKSDKRFFEALAKSKRYRDLKICYMSHKKDEKEEIQFAAMTILLPDGSPYLAFRGTDVSFVGWKEDFYLAFSEAIPAQIMAVDYLRKIAGLYNQPLYLGGHSKGGNLALYAATVVEKEIQDRIKKVYVHDGPGLTEELFHGEGYNKIKDRLQAIVPEESMVGILLMHPEEYLVVKSSATGGVLQHNPYSWQILGTQYILAEERKKDSHYVETLTKRWVEETDEEELKNFVESMFEFLQSSETDSVNELAKKVMKNPKILIQALRNIDEESQKTLRQTMGSMAGTAIQEATSEIKEATSEMTAGIAQEIKEATSELREKGKDLTLRNARKLKNAGKLKNILSLKNYLEKKERNDDSEAKEEENEEE